MSKKLKLGDIVKFNYKFGYSWSSNWHGVESEIVGIDDFQIVIKTKKVPPGFELGVGYITATSIRDENAYILIKGKNNKSHLPKWW